MPTNRRYRLRGNSNSLTSADLAYLRWGNDYFGSQLKTDEEMRQAWLANREQVRAHAARDIPDRVCLPVFAELRFDKKMSPAKARSTINAMAEKRHREYLERNLPVLSGSIQ